jgi:hypothetical protein
MTRIFGQCYGQAVFYVSLDNGFDLEFFHGHLALGPVKAHDPANFHKRQNPAAHPVRHCAQSYSKVQRDVFFVTPIVAEFIRHGLCMQANDATSAVYW